MHVESGEEPGRLGDISVHEPPGKRTEERVRELIAAHPSPIWELNGHERTDERHLEHGRDGARRGTDRRAGVESGRLKAKRAPDASVAAHAVTRAGASV